MSTGCLAANFHQAARTEYLAQYVFSAFGSSQMVARTEDYGLDFFCTLGSKIGQRLHVEDFYSVQVKSTEDEFSYNDAKSIEWLFSLKTPLLYSVIDKSSHTVKIYSGFMLPLLSTKQELGRITICYGGESKVEINEKNNEASICLGSPILEFNISELESRDFNQKAVSILEFWVKCDQENINRRSIGYSLFEYPLSYQTNEVPTLKTSQLSGNVLDTFKDEDLLNKQMTALYRSLGSQINFSSHGFDLDYFHTLTKAAIATLKKEELDDLDSSPRKLEINNLVMSIKAGCMYFKIDIPDFLEVQFSHIQAEIKIVSDL
ncbi:hypothetical protein ACXHQ0_27385 [Vibrio antiquarius]